jgi:hypothetical protein
VRSNKPFLPEDLPAFNALRVLRLSIDQNISRGTASLQDADAAVLKNCDQVKCLWLYGLRPKSLRELEEQLPQCEIDVH